MVNLTAALFFPKCYRNPSIDSFWRKRQILRMSAHLYGRSRNCFSLAIRGVQKALQYVVAGRTLRKQYSRFIWNSRITAACEELGDIPVRRIHRRKQITEQSPIFLESLARSNILLDRKSLSNLAIWEPRTFKAISKIAGVKAKQEGLTPTELGPPPAGVYTRGKL